MKKLILLLILFYCQLPTANCQVSYWQQQVNFTIYVTLNDKEHVLDGFAKMEYYNNSPDTLYYIWFHLWPNAYKNDLTAFSDQLLENGKTDFYFSNADKRGYINRLDFKVNGIVALTEDHPLHQDIIKIVLPQPLAPKSMARIQTPFHVQLPFNFSRGGHVGQSYQITQWFPKPAVYDRKGWHPMPYLDQGEFYSEFGNYEVQITLPKNYVVAATGDLQDAAEQSWLDKKIKKPVPCTDCSQPKKQQVDREPITSSKETKTIHFKEQDVHDFAWFADKSFIIYHDTLQLPGGRIINLYSYHLPKTTGQNYWAKSIQFIKNTILTRGRWLGEYPYDIVSVTEAEMGFSGGMEYPTITSISPVANEPELESVIEHEVGHNWNQGMLATNERDHPWMDEGINTFYDNRYNEEASYTVKEETGPATFFTKRIPKDLRSGAFKTITSIKKDQPIETPSEDFREINYGLIAYYKTGEWMKLLENELGRVTFDSCMHEYYRRWKFKHPYPEDLKQLMEEVSGKSLDQTFALLSKKGNLPAAPLKRVVKVASFFNLKNADQYHYIFAAPLAGFNLYDKLMIGGIIHNYTLPSEKFQFLLTPLYATGSKQLNGLWQLNYHWTAEKGFQKVEIGLNGSKFSSKRSMDTSFKNIYENFHKIVPYIKLYFRSAYRSNIVRWLDIRSFIIGEKEFDNYVYKTGSDSAFQYPVSFIKTNRYVNQLSFNTINSRALYPYSYQLQLQQGKDFYRVNITGDYFFNYAKGGGMSVRFFAAKFGYIGAGRLYTAFQYQPKLLGANGTDDYTYNDYFLGRTASTAYADIPVGNGGVAAQQIMIQNTGGLKLRMDPVSSQGQSENWIAALNFNSTLPDKIFPAKIPLKIFFDIGTYAEAWDKTNTATKFLYVGGLQLSLFKNVLNIYAPLIYSSVFKDYLKTDPEANKFIKKISFSIDIQQISLRKLVPKFPF